MKCLWLRSLLTPDTCDLSASLMSPLLLRKAAKVESSSRILLSKKSASGDAVSSLSSASPINVAASRRTSRNEHSGGASLRVLIPGMAATRYRDTSDVDSATKVNPYMERLTDPRG